MRKIYCAIREKYFYDDEPCWYQQGTVEDPTKTCVKCDYYKSLHPNPIEKDFQKKKLTKTERTIQKTKRSSYDGFLLDFCNVKKWNLNTILDLYENRYDPNDPTGEQIIRYGIHRDSEDDITSEKYRIRDCKTRHDSQHTYCLIKNERSKTLQKHTETFVLPSQAGFKKLYEYLQQSQAEYRKFLDSCIKGNLDLLYLNNLIKNIKNSEPMFFDNPKAFSGRVKKREQEFIKWNPIIYLMAHGKCIEDAIELEIIHMILRREGKLFSKVKRCIDPTCRDYFIYNRRSGETCSSKCHTHYNNLIKGAMKLNGVESWKMTPSQKKFLVESTNNLLKKKHNKEWFKKMQGHLQTQLKLAFKEL